MKEDIYNKKIIRLFFWGIVVLTVLRIGYFTRLPYYAVGDAGYDDRYLVDLANSILKGNWLGDYNSTTLIKGISFPLFLVLANKLSMTYSMLLGLYYVISAAAFSYALSKVIKNKIFIYMGYILLIYTPAGFASVITQRLYRNAIMFPSVLMVFACILLVYFYRKEKMHKQIFWMILLGINFAYFYYIREDSFWLIPLFLCSLLFSAIWMIWFSDFDRRRKIIRCTALLIPVLIWIISGLIYRDINYKNYGVFTINDRSAGSFADLTGNMIRIEDTSDSSRDYWISRDKLERIVDACPSLFSDKELIMEEYAGWAEEDGNVRGDWSVWALRIAFDKMGYYSEGASGIEQFCSQVNDELSDAVENGVLTFDDAIHFTTQSRGIYWDEIPGFIGETFKNMWDVMTYKEANAGLIISSGLEDQIRYMESMTGVNTIHPAVQSHEDIIINGWLIVKDDSCKNISLKVIDEQGAVIEEGIVLTERADVAEIYPDYSNAVNCGFEITLDQKTDYNKVRLQIYAGDTLIGETYVNTMENDDFVINIDQNSALIPDWNYIYSERIVNLSNRIIFMIRLLSKILLPLGLICYVVILAYFIRERTWENFEPIVILLGILLSMFILEFGVTVFNSWLGNIWFYSTGVVPLGQCFEIMSIAYCAKQIIKNKNDKSIQNV